MEEIVIGKIVNTFGLKGELKVLPKEMCEAYYKNLKYFNISKFDEEFECENISIKKGQFVKLKIKNYDNINKVLCFKNHDIIVKKEIKTELEEDEYLTVDLINCKILRDETLVGKVLDVENFGATDILVLDVDGKEARVPFVHEFFENIDVKNKRILITDKFFEGLVL